jgi:hypothetical protein
MKIYRDGKEYELTFSEMIQAHEEWELDCMVSDVKTLLEGREEVKLSEEEIGAVASFALHNLSKNDSYFEAYWMSVEYTLDNYIDNLPIDEEEDGE